MITIYRHKVLCDSVIRFMWLDAFHNATIHMLYSLSKCDITFGITFHNMNNSYTRDEQGKAFDRCERVIRISEE